MGGSKSLLVFRRERDTHGRGSIDGIAKSVGYSQGYVIFKACALHVVQLGADDRSVVKVVAAAHAPIGKEGSIRVVPDSVPQKECGAPVSRRDILLCSSSRHLAGCFPLHGRQLSLGGSFELASSLDLRPDSAAASPRRISQSFHVNTPATFFFFAAATRKPVPYWRLVSLVTGGSRPWGKTSTCGPTCRDSTFCEMEGKSKCGRSPTCGATTWSYSRSVARSHSNRRF